MAKKCTTMCIESEMDALEGECPVGECDINPYPESNQGPCLLLCYW